MTWFSLFMTLISRGFSVNKQLYRFPNDIEALHHLPMTAFEEQLKNRYKQYIKEQQHIFTAEEMKDYMTWLVNSSSENTVPRFNAEDIPSMLIGTNINSIGIRLLYNSMDKKALKLLTSQYDTQTEPYFFPKDQDITSCRVLRYMPSYWHQNSFFEVYYAFSGNTPIFFEHETFIMTPGTVLIIPPFVTQACTCSSDDSVIFSFTIRSSTFSKVFMKQLSAQNLMSLFFRQALNGTNTTSYLQFSTDSDLLIEGLLCYIDHQFRSDNLYRSQVINSVMSTFFFVLLQKFEHTARLSKKSSLSWKPEYIPLFHYIQNHYATVTLDELSFKFGYSSRQIIRIIKNCTGKTFSQLLILLRMEKAAQLLSQVPTPQTDEIASEVGYSTLSSFYRTFTAYYDCTPKEYLLSHSEKRSPDGDY